MNVQRLVSLKPKFGVTEAKKNKIDSIESDVKNAQRNVDFLQIIVDSLQSKSNEYQEILKQSKSSFDSIEGNQNTLIEIINNAEELVSTSRTARDEMLLARSKTDEMSTNMNIVVNKLIYSAEVISKLANLIVKRKAMNPLISDELMVIVNKLGEDANNAVSLSLIALKSAVSSQTSNVESTDIATLEVNQAENLLKILQGNKSSIKAILGKSFEAAKSNLDNALAANDDASSQLHDVNVKLKQAKVKLSSLEKSLAAAKAASTAS